jgi:hypothetical protein
MFLLAAKRTRAKTQYDSRKKKSYRRRKLPQRKKHEKDVKKMNFGNLRGSLRGERRAKSVNCRKMKSRGTLFT